MFAFREILNARKHELAEIIASEHGKVRSDALGEVGRRLSPAWAHWWWKTSLLGDTHAHGVEGVNFFTRGKVVTSRWLDPSHAGLDLGFPQNR